MDKKAAVIMGSDSDLLVVKGVINSLNLLLLTAKMTPLHLMEKRREQFITKE